MARVHPTPLIAALLGVAVGIAIGTAAGERPAPVARVAAPAPAPAPVVRALPPVDDAMLAAAVADAEAHLDAGRPWAAWRELRGHVDDPASAPDQLVLVAARAAAGWDGWTQVRRLLAGRPWLATHARGEGAFLLARAEEERENWNAAADAYGRYVALDAAPREAEAAARMGVALARAGNSAAAAEAFDRAARVLPEASDWLQTLRAESLANAGDARTVEAAASTGASAPAAVRQARAAARYWTGRGDTVRAVARLGAGEEYLATIGGQGHAAALAAERARLLQAMGRVPEARALLRRIASDPDAAGDVRAAAAERLARHGALTGDEHAARSGAYEAAGKHGLAARALRGALAAGADDPAAYLRLGRLLFEARDHRPARAALLDAAAKQTDPALAAEAELMAARALVRAGGDEGWTEMRRIVERRAGTPAAGTAAYLLGDAARTLDAGIAWYRRAAEVEGSPHAREALYRLGDRSAKNGDPAGAIAAWERFVTRHPAGELTARAAYRAGVLHERAGREARARAMYAAAIAADPLSYYAIRAADRAGTDPLAGALAGTIAWNETAADRQAAADALRRLDVLHKAGFTEAWQQELDWTRHRLRDRPGALLLLAEGLRDRGETIPAVRMAWALHEAQGGRWDARLLRVYFPFPYRALVVSEAERTDVDPFLLAGLVRQESAFDPEARSWVGATGLSQIMPATGAWLAPGIGISSFDPSLLAVPEINLRMGSRYLRDQLRRYGGKRDLALAAYNAGPGRADRWRRELGYGGDVDAWREAIPFAETRKYVQLVLRNAVVYRRLYGDDESPGMTARGS